MNLCDQREALLAMECDSDFLQGFYFARPAPDGADEAACRTVMDSPWQLFSVRVDENARKESVLLTTYMDAVQAAAKRVEAGIDIAQTCEEFLRLEGAERCFLLDAWGEQIGGDIMAARRASRSDHLRANIGKAAVRAMCATLRRTST